MADSLFDNRYRYDYIYPRGRSGETLRAIDPASDERPVVIKRPAPGDAPPIRAGQEVSIVNERRALRSLAGHPVLTELVGEGRFTVGGVPHQYIVMARAEGLIIEDLVLELAAQGERLPHLEMLVIMDALLDLLENAHAQDIIYNDVDAKHLFWNRDEYALKVIDWGNAVFLEGDTMTPQGISRQTDVYQTGELLYFILSGGRRADVPRSADVDFIVNFDDEVDVSLQQIVSRALHPDTRHRYESISALRHDLTAYRRPIERERNALLETLTSRLENPDLTRQTYRQLQSDLQPILALDPAYPPARTAHEDIINQQLDLNVEADLDAVQIYIQGGNPARALDLLAELRDKAGPATTGTVRLLMDICRLLMDAAIQPVPGDIMQALDMIFAGQASAAALSLLRDHPDPGQQSLHWQIAERISAHIPNVLLLRPNLFRLQSALRQLGQEGFNVRDYLAVFTDLAKLPEASASQSVDLPMLQENYRSIADQLTVLNRDLQRFSLQHEFSNRRLPLSSLERATTAAQQVTDSLHIIGRQAASRPRDTFHALDISRNIDPTASAWIAIETMLESLYTLLETCQTYIPVADGTDLAAWLIDTYQTLQPFEERLNDNMLTALMDDLRSTDEAWETYRLTVLQGDKEAAVSALEIAAERIQTLSPTLQTWFRQLHSVVEGAQHIERHSVPAEAGAALADGWLAFDRGNLLEAEQLGQQAMDAAHDENEQFAGSRLRHLAQLTRLWIERRGIFDVERSQAQLDELRDLFTDEERALLDNFTEQMPNAEVYLRVMSKGVVDVYERRSSAALRILFMQYVITSGLDMREERVDDARFWREAALKTMDTAENHVAFEALERYIARYDNLQDAGAIFDKVDHKGVLDKLDDFARELEKNPQAELLQPGIESLRDVQSAVERWSDGDFRAAGLKLEAALKGITELENSADLNLNLYRDWLMTLMQGAAELHVSFREMRGVIDARPDTPDPLVQQAHHRLVDETTALLGADYAARLRQWRDTYDNFLDVYAGDDRRSKRLEQLNALFRAMFIDKHPAYPLYRHWYSVLEGASEFPAPATSDPTPRIESNVEETFAGSRYLDGGDSAPSSGLPRGALVGGAIAVVLVGIVALVLITLGNDNDPLAGIDLIISPTPDTIVENVSEEPDETEAASSNGTGLATNTTQPDEAAAITTDDTEFATPTPRPDETATPTATNTDIPTETPIPVTPTDGPSPTASDTPTNTPTETNTPLPTRTPLPENGVQGRQDVLALFEGATSSPYSSDVFDFVDDSWRLGSGLDTPGDILYISPPEAWLEEFYGNNAMTRIARVEANIELSSKNPGVVNADDIFFGLLMQSAEDGNNAGIRIQETDENIIQIFSTQNNDFEFISLQSIGSVDVRLRIDRDRQTGDATIYFNDVQQGTLRFIDADAPILPVIFVKDGGVIVRVKSWFITLR